MKATGHAGLDEPFAGMFTQGMVVHETYRAQDGSWVEPGDVRIEVDGAQRRGFHVETGAPIEIGAIEKMSKSKKNVVDPDDIIASYGADTARWFMLSDSPPDRDVIWTDEGVQGAARFVQLLWRLVGEIAERTGNRADAPPAFGDVALTLRKASHRALPSEAPALGFSQCCPAAQRQTTSRSAPTRSGSRWPWQRRPTARCSPPSRPATRPTPPPGAPGPRRRRGRCWAIRWRRCGP